MGILNKLARKLKQTGVSHPAGRSNNTDIVGTDGADAVVEEEHVDYTCPTLKDVSVKGGQVNSPNAFGDSGCGGAPTKTTDTTLVPDSDGLDGNIDNKEHQQQLDMRSEMDTMSIGSASELTSEDAEFYSSRLNSALAKRDRVSRVLAELEREEADVRRELGEPGDGDFAKLSALVKKYNDIAVGCMEGSSLDKSLECLLKAHALLEDVSAAVTGGREQPCHEGIERLRSITYNNLGCLYRRMAKPERALSYLQKALAIEQTSADPKVNELASTHLNLSASYSVLHRDVEALRHGERAIVLLQGQLWPGMSFKDGMEMLLARVSKEGGTMPPQLVRDAHVLSMAYHNVGTQNERLGRIREAQVSFNRACSIGTKILGPSDRTTVTLQMNNRMFLQRNGGVSKSSGLQRTRSGVALNSKASSGGASAKSAGVAREGGKVGSAKLSAHHSRAKSSSVKGKK